MERLQSGLAWFKKNHFWVLSVVGVLVVLVAWYLSTSSLDEKYVADKMRITDEFEKIGRVASEPAPKNEALTKEKQEELNKLIDDVYTAWKYCYDLQQKALNWPPDLGDKFYASLKKLGPNEEIPADLRDTYALHIPTKEYSRLVKLGQARHLRDLQGEDITKGVSSILDWSVPSQTAIYNSLNWSQQITTRQMRLAQEDLWVYEAILKIIQKLNTPATGHYNARVRVIREMEVGERAARRFEAGLQRGELLFPPDVQEQEPDPLPAVEVAADPAQAKHLEPGRYVDEYGRPLAAESAHPVEFRRLPLHLNLTVDQREISNLLAELAESELQIEVRQFRINPGTIPPGARANLGPASSEGEGPTKEGEKAPYDMRVDILAFVYLYNPPDKKLLLPAVTPEETETAGSEGGTPITAIGGGVGSVPKTLIALMPSSP